MTRSIAGLPPKYPGLARISTSPLCRACTENGPVPDFFDVGSTIVTEPRASSTNVDRRRNANSTSKSDTARISAMSSNAGPMASGNPACSTVRTACALTGLPSSKVMDGRRRTRSVRPSDDVDQPSARLRRARPSPAMLTSSSNAMLRAVPSIPKSGLPPAARPNPIRNAVTGAGRCRPLPGAPHPLRVIKRAAERAG